MGKIAFIRKMLGQNKGKLLLAIIVIMIYTSLMLVSPLLFSFMIDNVINLLPIDNPVLKGFSDLLGGVETIRNNLWIGALMVIGVNVLIGLFFYLRGRLNASLAESISKNIKDSLYEHLSYLPYAYHVKSQSGDLIQRCTSDVDQIRRVFASQIAELVYAVTMTFVALFVLFSINSSLALIATISMPIIFIFAFVFFIKMQHAFLASDEAEGAMSNVIQENLAATRVVKAFNREYYETEVFDKKNREFYDKTIRMNNLLGLYWGVSDFICLMQILIVILVGIQYANNGQITVGNFFVFISYEGMILWPIRQVGRILSDIGKVSVSLGRLLEVLNEPAEDVESGLKPEIKGNIEFKDVHFHYEDEEDVLKGLTLNIKAGQTVAIIGPTGSGKSTIVHLLCRLYDYQSGEILLDGIPLRQIAKHHVRANVGIVLQEPFLYSKSIYENIATVKPEATMEEVQQAAQIAHIDHVIKDFDLGYRTLVGEKGVTLSGGQKQRVAIARTVINNAPILIFDDSLSAVDTETDAAIRQALKQRSREVTTIIITQRVSASEHADVIFIIDQGRVVQSGSHQELLAQDGLYRRIYDIQSQMVTEEGETHE